MRVFVSYRRSDSKDFAARLADRLRQLWEIDEVFFDVESIGYGEQFPQRLEQEIDRADVIVAVIGSGWQGVADASGVTRINSEGDFVRAEIAHALRAGMRLIPVLVDDAAMPAKKDLPSDVATLAEYNALTFRHTTFRQDFDLLAEAVLQHKPAGAVHGIQLYIGAGIRAAIGLLAAMALSIAIAASGVAMLEMPLETVLGGRVQLAIFLLGLFGALQWWTYRYLKRNLT